MEILAVVSILLSAAGVLSGAYTLFVDALYYHRLKDCPVEYAALALSTFLCAVFVIATIDWLTAETMVFNTLERGALFYMYHTVERLVVLLFHTVVLVRVVRPER